MFGHQPLVVYLCVSECICTSMPGAILPTINVSTFSVSGAILPTIFQIVVGIQ